MTGWEPRVRLVRLLPGAVGETRRVCHIVPVDDGRPLDLPEVLVAYCGARLAGERVELLSRVRGQPCVGCLMRVRLPGLQG